MRRWLVALGWFGLLALLAAGCVEAELGEVPVLCNPGTPRCPSGYSCMTFEDHDYCIKDGVDPSRALGIAPDAGRDRSGASTDSASLDAGSPDGASADGASIDAISGAHE